MPPPVRIFLIAPEILLVESSLLVTFNIYILGTFCEKNGEKSISGFGDIRAGSKLSGAKIEKNGENDKTLKLT